jgi:hypothetical protein
VWMKNRPSATAEKLQTDVDVIEYSPNIPVDTYASLVLNDLHMKSSASHSTLTDVNSFKIQHSGITYVHSI